MSPLNPDGTNKVRSINWMKVYRLSNHKPFPEHDTAYLPRPCMQCGKPSCVSVCPVVATDKNEDGGIVSQIYPRCIGCRYCMASCPYHARYFNWYDPELAGRSWKRTLTPGRFRPSPRRGGKMHRSATTAGCTPRTPPSPKGRRPLWSCPTAHTSRPAPEACPNGAIYLRRFRRIPNTRCTSSIRSPHAFRLLERLGTDPQVYYLSKREWVRRQGDNYLENEKTKG